MKFPWFPPTSSPSALPPSGRRSRWGRSHWRGLGLGLLAVGVLLGALAWGAVRQSWPIDSGRLRVAGLTAPVEVVRDAQGIPQIYAENTQDLMFAQGYIQAQDRFWQMDIWRHVGAGRLAEVFGESQVETDRFLQTLGWEAIAQREWEQIEAEDPDLRQVLVSYAAGVNAYLADRRGTQLSLEHGILGLLNRGYEPAPWHPVNSLTWAKVMAYDLCKNFSQERMRLALKQLLAPERVDELFPPPILDHPAILLAEEFQLEVDLVRPLPDRQARGGSPGLGAGAWGFDRGNLQGPDLGLDPPSVNGKAPFSPDLDGLSSDLAASLDFLDRADRSLRQWISPNSTSLGSNNWVVSGDRTRTGQPLLADDPHLGVQLPSIWYGVGLHCKQRSPSCPYNVVGVTFPSVPGVVVGHNDRIAWGVTNVGSDVMDLYLEKLNPANPNQYERDGQWVDLAQRAVMITVAGQEPVPLQVRSTVHGPLLSDVEPQLQAIELTPEAVGDRSGADPAPRYAIALRWTALEPSRLLGAVQKLNLAQNWTEFRTALQDFDVPAQNFVYADIDGNIGYQMPGKLPLRQGFDGRDPVPGWDSRYDWRGYLPFEQLPTLFNPDRGWIATANEPVLNPDPATPDRLPIPGEYTYGYRAQRIADLITQAAQPFTPASLGEIQLDVLNLNAQDLIPALLNLKFEDPLAQTLQQQLGAWDCQQTADSAEAALFETFWFELLAQVFRDEIPPPYWPDGDSQWFAVVRSLRDQPQNPWWDDVRTPATEDRDQALAQAWTTAIATVQDLLGPDPQNWRWGDLHTLTFDNTTLGRSGIVPLERLLNRGPYPAPGGAGLVNALGWGARRETAAEALQTDTLPSMRLVLNPAQWDQSLWIHAPGQSGHPFHRHYADLIQPWLSGRWFPLPWSPDRPPTAGSHLTLLP